MFNFIIKNIPVLYLFSFGSTEIRVQVKMNLKKNYYPALTFVKIRFCNFDDLNKNLYFSKLIRYYMCFAWGLKHLNQKFPIVK